MAEGTESRISLAWQSFSHTAREVFRRKDKVKPITWFAAAVALTFAAIPIDRYGLSGLSHRLVRDYSVPLSIKPICTDPHASEDKNRASIIACKAVALKIPDAVTLWRATMRDRLGHKNLANYLDTELALRAAGIESDMGRLRHSRHSSYEGLFQFSRTDKNSLLLTEMDDFLKVINAAKKEIPVLAQYKKQDITKEILLSDDVYHDTTIQVFLKMTSAYLADIRLSNNYPQGYDDQTPDKKRMLLYLGHNLPTMAKAVALNWNCDSEMQYLLSPDFVSRNISSNSGLYEASGRATAWEIYSRFRHLTDPYIKLFAPQITAPGQPGEPHPYPAHPGKYGFLSFFMPGNFYSSGTCKFIETPTPRTPDSSYMLMPIAPL